MVIRPYNITLNTRNMRIVMIVMIKFSKLTVFNLQFNVGCYCMSPVVNTLSSSNGYFFYCAGLTHLFRVSFFKKIGLLSPIESENGFYVSLLNRSIHGLSDHGASKEPKNRLWTGQAPVQSTHK